MGKSVAADPGYADRVRASFAAQGLLRTLGAEIAALAPGHCTVTAPIRPDTAQQHGFAHAGLSFTIGDVACGYAALSLLDAEQEVLTSEMKINLLAPAKGRLLNARGEVIRAGRRLIVTRAEVFASDPGRDETHVATMLGTIVPVARAAD